LGGRRATAEVTACREQFLFGQLGESSMTPAATDRWPVRYTPKARQPWMWRWDRPSRLRADPATTRRTRRPPALGAAERGAVRWSRAWRPRHPGQRSASRIPQQM